jgi:hypothetical protein
MREYGISLIQLLEELSTHPEGRALNIRLLTPINNTIKKLCLSRNVSMIQLNILVEAKTIWHLLVKIVA